RPLDFILPVYDVAVFIIFNFDRRELQSIVPSFGIVSRDRAVVGRPFFPADPFRKMIWIIIITLTFLAVYWIEKVDGFPVIRSSLNILCWSRKGWYLQKIGEAQLAVISNNRFFGLPLFCRNHNPTRRSF